MPLDLLEPIIVNDDGILSDAAYDLIAESEPSVSDRDELIAAILALAILLASQEISTREFQSRVAALLRDLHWVKANELLNAIDENLRQIIQDGLKDQYYRGRDTLTLLPFGLAWLARDIINGKNSLPQVQSRLRAFTNSDTTLERKFERELARRQGLTYGVRRLAAVDHCPSCPIYASYPPLPVDELVMPTEACECRTNCKCTIEYMSLEEAIRQGASVPLGFL